MSKATKIAISLPEDLLEIIERERRESGESRSQFFRRAVEAFLRRKQERKLEEQYIRGYQRYPETEEELALAHWANPIAFGENPWEVDDKP